MRNFHLDQSWFGMYSRVSQSLTGNPDYFSACLERKGIWRRNKGVGPRLDPRRVFR